MSDDDLSSCLTRLPPHRSRNNHDVTGETLKIVSVVREMEIERACFFAKDFLA